jgi:hypothetical protein
VTLVHNAKRLTRLLVVAGGAIIAAGCAHPITMSPDVSKVQREGNAAPLLAKNVGYYIPAEKRDLAVTTPGGGGDSVTYHPYRDIEAAFYKMLSNVFADVTVLTAPNDADAFSKRNIKFVVTPQITTSSSSPSPFTWPPTYFGVALTCNIADASGTPVVTKSVMGQGRAEYDEFKSDFSLAARRAAQDALLQMQELLLSAPELGR